MDLPVMWKQNRLSKSDARDTRQQNEKLKEPGLTKVPCFLAQEST